MIGRLGPARRTPHTLPYTYRRTRRRVTAARRALQYTPMIFDHPPAELPVATLRGRAWAEQLGLDLRSWLAARWRWLKPRSIPCAVAIAGMLGVMASATYLREFARQAPERLPARVHAALPAPAPSDVSDASAPPAADEGTFAVELVPSTR